MRVLIGLLVVVLLAGCDREKPAAGPVSASDHEPAPASGSVSLRSASDPAPRMRQLQEQEPPDIEIESVAEPEPEPPTEPELTVKLSPPAPPKVRAAPKEASLPPPELDLSLPDEWMEALEEGEARESALLPPLFAVPEPAPAVHVSGRLIPWVEGDETVIDGAQLDFEFKR